MSSKEEIFLKSNNFIPSKKMGQNFLVNGNIQKAIVNSSNITEDDCVLEIGPGLGAITKHILEKTKNFIAVELDKRLHDFLKKNYPNTNIINDDILKIDIGKILIDNNFSNVKVVANLPYSISSKIILKLLRVNEISEINILVQKEMAERLLAKVNTKDYNAFTVLVSMYSNISEKINVSRNEFNPAPKVDSKFIKLEKIDKFKNNIEDVNKFLQKCFIAKRKKLTNNLKHYYDINLIHRTLSSLGIDENVRAENLTIDQFNMIFNTITRG